MSRPRILLAASRSSTASAASTPAKPSVDPAFSDIVREFLSATGG